MSDCPGCGGPKSKRAQLCAGCRRTANEVGVSVLTHVHEAATPAPPAPRRPRTPEQNKVYHGKINSLARVQKIDFLEAKRLALELASAIAGRELASSTELSEIEMERVLEALDQRLAQLGFARVPTG